MCQPISGPRVKFEKPKKMWKVVRTIKQKVSYSAGPFHHTYFTRTGWAQSTKPRQTVWESTKSGYHVFVSKTGATAYATLAGTHVAVVPVYVKGEALPFTFHWTRGHPHRKYKGYAVQYWRRAE